MNKNNQIVKIILILCILSISMLMSCTNKSSYEDLSPSEYNELYNDSDIRLVITNISDTSKGTIQIELINNSENEIIFPSEATIEVKINEQWYQLGLIKYIRPQAFVIESNKNLTYEFPLSSNDSTIVLSYDNSKNKINLVEDYTYRLVSNINIGNPVYIAEEFTLNSK